MLKKEAAMIYHIEVFFAARSRKRKREEAKEEEDLKRKRKKSILETS